MFLGNEMYFVFLSKRRLLVVAILCLSVSGVVMDQSRSDERQAGTGKWGGLDLFSTLLVDTS